MVFFFFFFNDTATTEIYTLSLHDALPISPERGGKGTAALGDLRAVPESDVGAPRPGRVRSEEHTSELQSRLHLVCRLLLEKKNTRRNSDGRVHLDRGSSYANWSNSLDRLF